MCSIHKTLCSKPGATQKERREREGKEGERVGGRREQGNKGVREGGTMESRLAQ